MLKAIIFDCDGVLVDTEMDGHLIAFNKAFIQKGYKYQWNVDLYKELLKVAGGKERIRHFFEMEGWPADAVDKDIFIKELHTLKTDIYMRIVESGELQLRTGVARLVDEAVTEGLSLAVCSNSNERAVNLIVEKLLGSERKAHFNTILAGDIVSRKKPDPEIYNLALTHLKLEPHECFVIEDNRNGLLAARAASMLCVITTNKFTDDEDFTEADLVVSELGDPPHVKVTVEILKELAGKR